MGPDEWRQRVIDLTNEQRQAAGLDPLRQNDRLNRAAEDYAKVLALGTCFGHECGPVPSVGDRLHRACYTGKNPGENLMAGGKTQDGLPDPDRVMAVWMLSPGHRANILDPTYTDVSVGWAFSDVPGVDGHLYGIYWVQDFGTTT